MLTAAQAPLYTGRSREVGEGVAFRNVGTRPGDAAFFVVVKGAYDKSKKFFNPDVPYTLTVSLEDGAGDTELEPNDDPAHATPILSGQPKKGFLTPKGDLDYFVAHCDQPSLANLDLSGVDRVDTVLSVVEPPAEGTEKEAVVLSANDGAVKEGETFVNVACQGDLVIKVEGAARKVDGKWVKDFENANDPYKLSVTVRPDPGNEEREPDGTPATATPIELKRPMRGHVHPKRDVDYFRLDLSNAQVKTPLKITATGLLKVDVGLYLHRLDGDKPVLVQTADKAKGDQPEVLRYAADPGVYLVEVRDAKNRESNYQDPYQVTVETE